MDGNWKKKVPYGALACHIFWFIFPVRYGIFTPLQYSCLETPMDGGAWWAAVHGVTEGRTRLSDFTFTFHFHALEKELATRSSVLAWRIPGTGEPDGLPSMGSHRVGHDWSDLAAAAAAWHFQKRRPGRVLWSYQIKSPPNPRISSTRFRIGHLPVLVWIFPIIGSHCLLWKPNY